MQQQQTEERSQNSGCKLTSNRRSTSSAFCQVSWNNPYQTAAAATWHWNHRVIHQIQYRDLPALIHAIHWCIGSSCTAKQPSPPLPPTQHPLIPSPPSPLKRLRHCAIDRISIFYLGHTRNALELKGSNGPTSTGIFSIGKGLPMFSPGVHTGFTLVSAVCKVNA